jgi:hypothetical protein
MIVTYATLTVTFSLFAAGLKHIDRQINDLPESADFLYGRNNITELEEFLASKAARSCISA